MVAISVVIPTFNRASYLRLSLASVLSQTHRDFEVIVVDDGSSDDIEAVVAEFGDRRVRYIRQENAGVSAARNNGAAQAGGRYLLFLDSDDILATGALNLLVNPLERDATLGLSAGGWRFIDADGTTLSESQPWVSDPDLCLKTWLFRCPIIPSGTLIRRGHFVAIGGFDETRRSGEEDYDLWLRLAYAGCRMEWVHAPVCGYRMHGSNTIRNAAKQTRGVVKVFQDFFGQPGLPENVRALEAECIGRVHLRGAIREFAVDEAEDARADLRTAITLHPHIVDDDGEEILQHLLAWSKHPTVEGPLQYIDRALRELPNELSALRARRREALAKSAAARFFERRISGLPEAWAYLTTIVLNDPRWLLNRGLISIFARQHLRSICRESVLSSGRLGPRDCSGSRGKTRGEADQTPTMVKLAMTYSGRHDRHPIILRQQAMLESAGARLTVVDVACPAERSATTNHRSVAAARLPLVRGPLWKALHRLVRGRAAEAYWTCIAAAEDVLTGVALGGRVLRSGADLLVAHDIWALLGAHLVGAIRRVPVVYSAHELASEQYKRYPLRHRLIRFIESLLIPRSSLVIVPNRSRAAHYQESYRLGDRLEVIPNCPPLVEYANTNRLRQILSLDKRVKIVLYHGTYMGGRCLDRLILSTEYLDDAIVLVLIGEKNEYYVQHLESLVDRFRGRIFTIPYIENGEIMEYVASADLGIVIYENTNLNNYYCAPTKLYDFIMARVPVASCDFPGTREVLDVYPIGVSFDPEDSQSIARAINKYFRSAHGADEAVGRALERARLDLSWDVVSPCLLKRLLQLAGSRPKQSRLTGSRID